MRRKLILKARGIFAITLLTTTLICNSQDVNPSLYGLEINSKVQLPECTKRENYSGPALLAYASTNSSTPSCIKKTSNDSADVHIQGITISKNNQFTVFFRNELIDRIDFYTYGTEDQEEVFEKLSSKFGKPRKISRPRVQNRMGATFRVLDAEWRIGTSYLNFTTNTGSLDGGQVQLLSYSAFRELQRQRIKPARDENL